MTPSDRHDDEFLDDDPYFQSDDRTPRAKGSFDAALLRESVRALPARYPLTFAPHNTVTEAIRAMQKEHRGVVLITSDGSPESRVLGIFTERDVLALAGDGTDLNAVKVGDVMTRNPVTVDADVQVLDAARLMGERRIRHVPVVEGGHLLGMVGIRDVLGSLVERAWQARDTDAHDTARSLFRRD
ncbi:MAG TPA: CBS domain-containing protein [Myxococcota bacterium]|nr:CBS domain-containing protein [Myxococcota bacterium]